jgi:hypothetical protein
MNEHTISQLLVPAVFALIAIARAFAGTKNKSSGQPTGRPLTRSDRPPADTEAERQRRFREALGLPPGSAPPPLVQPRAAQSAQGPLPSVTFPRTPTSPNQARRIYTGVPHKAGTPAQVQPAPYVAPAPAAPPPMRQPAPAFQSDPQAPLIPLLQTKRDSRTTAAAAPAPVRASSGELLASLRDPASIRRAIILREVLGPPKALQPAFASGGI